MSSTQAMITHTRNWVEKVIMKYNICPLARKEVEKGAIRYVIAEANDTASVLQLLLNECHLLSEQDEIETTLFIMPTGFEGFYGFLDVVEMANDLLELEGYEGVYQLASFHPDYCFEGEPQSEPSNFTNRSPYPTLHIIRETSMALAIQHHPGVDAIPQRNIEFANKRGNAFFADLLASCLLNK